MRCPPPRGPRKPARPVEEEVALGVAECVLGDVVGVGARSVSSSAVCSEALPETSPVGALGVLGPADGVGAAAGADGLSERAQSTLPSAASSGPECAAAALVSTAGGR
jgi:hypothetical protein